MVLDVIEFRLDQRSGVPTYLQLVQQVKQALRLGILQPGDQLPTVKEVVSVVAVNPNTVFKAYRHLEHEGLVQGRPGVGTFVLRPPAGPPPETQSRLRQRLRRWMDSAREAGLDEEAIEALVSSTLHEMDDEAIA